MTILRGIFEAFAVLLGLAALCAFIIFTSNGCASVRYNAQRPAVGWRNLP